MIGPGAGVRGPNPTFLFSEVRVYEDGANPIKPEAKFDWARGGCAGAKCHPKFLIVLRVIEDGVSFNSPEAIFD